MTDLTPSVEAGLALPTPGASGTIVPDPTVVKDTRLILKDKFNLSDFRTHQEQIVKDILDKRDLLVLMPTGGGKSLCYQLSALISPGFSLIISPLIALIWDQISDLKEKGIEALAWSSDLSLEEMHETKEAVKSGRVKILYTTPEMLIQSSQLNNLIMATSVSTPVKTGENTQERKPLLDRIIVDEAHCVSNWGHEFRESYLELVSLKKKMPNIQIVALTATATPAVQLDIIRILGLSRVKIYRQSYIRENLHYFVKKRETGSKLKSKESLVEQILLWIKQHDYARKTGIIYCLSRDNSEELAAALQEKGLSAEFFHASMPVEEKRATQKRWLTGETKIIVATIAFALGINKPNVRFVIHAALPKSIEGFYQETGRAGRDGKISRCLLLYNRQDKHILQSMALKSQKTSVIPSSMKRGMDRFVLTKSDVLIPEVHVAPIDSVVRTEDMYQWALSTLDCRIESLSRYLGESVIYSCGNCDNCLLNDTASHGRGKIQPIKRSVKDFLIAAINCITSMPVLVQTATSGMPVLVQTATNLVSKDDLLHDVVSNLNHYSGYDRFRVFLQLEALGYLSVKYQLDRSGHIHTNVYLGPRLTSKEGEVEIENLIKDEDLIMNFTNGTLDSYISVTPS